VPAFSSLKDFFLISSVLQSPAALVSFLETENPPQLSKPNSFNLFSACWKGSHRSHEAKQEMLDAEDRNLRTEAKDFPARTVRHGDYRHAKINARRFGIDSGQVPQGLASCDVPNSHD